MAQIVSATDSGYRKIIVVRLNPEEPEFIHSDQTLHAIDMLNGCPDAIDGASVCRANWKDREFIFYSDQCQVADEQTGELRPWEIPDYLEAIRDALYPAYPQDISGLAGLTIFA